MDEITLTLPADDAFTRVAHLVLGGLAVRLDLTVEVLEDLELALDALLERCEELCDDEVILRVQVSDEEVRTFVGPFHADLRSELDGDADETLDLRRILRAVSDDVVVVDGDGGQWVELTKRVARTEVRT